MILWEGGSEDESTIARLIQVDTYLERHKILLSKITKQPLSILMPLNGRCMGEVADIALF